RQEGVADQGAGRDREYCRYGVSTAGPGARTQELAGDRLRHAGERADPCQLPDVPWQYKGRPKGRFRPPRRGTRISYLPAETARQGWLANFHQSENDEQTDSQRRAVRINPMDQHLFSPPPDLLG